MDNSRGTGELIVEDIASGSLFTLGVSFLWHDARKGSTTKSTFLIDSLAAGEIFDKEKAAKKQD